MYLIKQSSSEAKSGKGKERREPQNQKVARVILIHCVINVLKKKTCSSYGRPYNFGSYACIGVHSNIITREGEMILLCNICSGLNRDILDDCDVSRQIGTSAVTFESMFAL